MLHYQILLLIALLFAILGLHILSAKVKISYPILLVMGGGLISAIPGVPAIELNPDWVFLIFLPPLLYEAAWYTSWRDFWRQKYPIGILAFGLVFFTSMVVAYFAHFVIPGFTLAVGFLLGGIISPPDAVTAETILKGIKAPEDAVTIIKGESLINDAASIIVFKFAVAAVLTGNFVLQKASINLVWVAVGGIFAGVAIAQTVYFTRKHLDTTPSIDTAITLLSPYLFYLIAESLHCSGVLAVVAGGLFLSYRSHEFLSAKSNVQSGSVFSTLTFLLNSFLFLLIGLQLPVVIKGLADTSLLRATFYACVVSILTIAVRMIWVFLTAAAMQIPRRKKADWKRAMLIAWAGMRGVVSLASALAIPLTLTGGSPFPRRDLILYITFFFILVTLVGQGLSLPVLIRRLRFKMDAERGTQEMQRESMSMRLALVAMEHLDLHYHKECTQIPMFAQLRTSYESVVSFALVAGGGSRESEKARALDKKYKQAMLELIDVQRKELIVARRESTYDHELTLETEDQLNLEETRLTRTEVEPGTPTVTADSETISPDYHLISPGSQIINPTSRLIDPSEFKR